MIHACSLAASKSAAAPARSAVSRIASVMQGAVGAAASRHGVNIVGRGLEGRRPFSGRVWVDGEIRNPLPEAPEIRRCSSDFGPQVIICR